MKYIFRISIVLLAAIGAYFLFFNKEVEQTEAPATVVGFVDRPQYSPIKTLLVRYNDEHQNIFSCQQGRCDYINKPAVISDKALTNGYDWYFYNEKDEKIFLKHFVSSKEQVQTIMEETPLTKPRGMYISSDASQIAFYLDNIGEEEDKLTEIWSHNIKKGEIRLLAEKLYIPDIRSRLHWNHASSFIYFLADVGEREEEDKLALILVDTRNPSMKVSFDKIDWSKSVGSFDNIPMDVSQLGDKLAYVRKNIIGQTIISTVDENKIDQTSVKGNVPYLQWLEGESLLYAVQDRKGFTFWRRNKDGVHRFISRQLGTLSSALGDGSSEYTAFIVDNDHLYSLNNTTGIVTDEGTLMKGSGHTRIVNVSRDDSVKDDKNHSTIELDDAEIVAFIENNIDSIVGQTDNKLIRIIITDQPSTIYIDFQRKTKEKERILVKVQDAIHAEWSIRAKYIVINGEWQKVQGGGLNDPNVLRLYEWEDSLEQWILKKQN